jgi:cytochrome c-type biogenesis protein CcmE
MGATQLTEEQLHTRNRRRFAIAALGVAAVAFIAIAMGGIGRNLVYYWGPAELKAAGAQAIGASIRLGGQVAPGSIVKGAGSQLQFDVQDGKATVRVMMSGTPPQMFREGIGVVVEGTMSAAGHFEGQRLMVSHGNEYRPPSEHGQVDIEKLIRSTEGLDGQDRSR